MDNQSTKIKSIHQILFFIFPAIALFNSNVHRLNMSDIISPLCFAFISFFVLFYILKLFKLEETKFNIILSLSSVILYIGFYSLRKAMFMFLVFDLVVLIAFFVIRRKEPLISLTKILNLVSLYLILSQVVPIVSYKTFHSFNPKPFPIPVVESKANPTRKPDIYYFIFDRYASNHVLKKYYSFNNKDFLEKLKNRGFYVASNSYSNYLETKYSLASSLNLNYLDAVSNAVPKRGKNLLPLQVLMEDNVLMNFLKNHGYKYFHFGAWWDPTMYSKFADRNINKYPFREFSEYVFRYSAFFALFRALDVPFFDGRVLQYKNELYKFQELANVPLDKNPTFVFAHFLVPHPPYVFDKEGKFIPYKNLSSRSRNKNYTEQVIFTNTQIEKTIDAILSKSEIPPIIVIQADEGPYPKRFGANVPKFEWDKATQEELDEKAGILNAYYLPGFDKNKLYSSITPVNSFRLILNHYFKTNLPLLPDKIFAHKSRQEAYSFFEVKINQ